jgi:hypothetical protein
MLKQVSLVTGKCILLPGLLKPGGSYFSTYIPTVSRLEQAEQIVEAASRLKAAAFLNISCSGMLNVGRKVCERVERWKAELEIISGGRGIPVAFGFTEANSAQWVGLALEAGCTSVKVDPTGSRVGMDTPLSLKDNIRLTREAFVPAAGTNLTRIGVLPLQDRQAAEDKLADELQQFLEGTQVEAVVFDLAPFLLKETSFTVANEPIVRILASLEKARARCPQTPFILKGIFNAPEEDVAVFNSLNHGDQWVEGYVGLENISFNGGQTNLLKKAQASGLVTAVLEEKIPDLVYFVALGKTFGPRKFEESRGCHRVQEADLFFHLVEDKFRRFLTQRIETLGGRETVSLVQREDFTGGTVLGGLAGQTGLQERAATGEGKGEVTTVGLGDDEYLIK